MTRLHEPSFVEIIQKSLQLFKENFKTLALIALFATVLQQIAQVYMNQLGLNEMLKAASEQGMQAAQNTAGSSQIVTIALLSIGIALIELIITAFFQYHVNEYWQDKQTSISQSFQSVFRVLPVLIVTSVIVKFVCGVFFMGYLFFVGILLSALFLVYVPVILLEKKGIFQSLKDCVGLTKLSYFQCLGVTLFTLAMMLIPSLVSMLLNQAQGVGFGLEQTLSVLLSTIIYPFVSIVILAQYYALKAKQSNLQLV